MVEMGSLLFWPVLGALLASVPLAYFGVFLVERRMVFVSVTLAQAAVAGAAAAAFLHAPPRLCALAASALLVALLIRPRSGRPFLPEDSLLGVLYVGAGSLAVVLLAASPGAGLDETALLFGTLLGVGPRDAAVLGVAAALSGLLALFLHRRYLAVAFDPETARVLGEPVTLVETAFFGSLGLVISLSIGLLGVLLTFGLLVLPAAAVRGLARKTVTVFAGAQAVAAASVVGGTALSARLDWPTGAVIGLVLAGLVLTAWLLWRLLSPER